MPQAQGRDLHRLRAVSAAGVVASESMAGSVVAPKAGSSASLAATGRVSMRSGSIPSRPPYGGACTFGLDPPMATFVLSQWTGGLVAQFPA